MRSSTSEKALSPEASGSRPVLKRLLVAELKCYLCGASAGRIESERQPMPPSVILRRDGDANGVRVLDWRRLRCERCQGRVYLEGPEVVTRRVESFDWSQERPRRGRPPKWLVEERRREQRPDGSSHRPAA